MKIANCGCGCKYIVDENWINVDFNAYTDKVISHNLVKSLPFEDESIDCIFSSCMLEHFSREQAENFLKESFRCLKEKGIIRIVIPDLEDVCKEYLNVLEKVQNNEEYKEKYEYVVIELLDQMTRKKPGGEMKKYWEKEEKDEEYILERTGYPEIHGIGKIPFMIKVNYAKNILIDKLFGKFKFYNTYKLGKFMESGEVHMWMYDKYSIMQLLARIGFSEIEIKQFNQSRIPGWSEYGIETNKDGTEYKPHCLYVEGIKRK